MGTLGSVVQKQSDINFIVPSTSKEKLQDESDIPSPFKSSLFWPKPIVNSKPKRTKEKVPSVATSDQWRAYHRKKQEDKENKEKEMKERKRKREEVKQRKLEEKQNKKVSKRKRRTQQVQAKDDSSSNSSTEVVLESEGEGDDWAENYDEDNNQEMRVEQYVIVKYDDSYYPGE